MVESTKGRRNKKAKGQIDERQKLELNPKRQRLKWKIDRYGNQIKI